MSRRVMSKGPHSYVRPVEVVVPYALVAIALVAAGIAVPGFLSSSHLSALSITAAYLGIIAIGQTMVLLLGGIDLSVPYMINLAAILMAGLQFSHVAAGADFLIVIGFGVGAGLVNGLGVALLDISPLVMTLGMNSILEGVALIYSNGSPQGIAPTFVTNLSTGGTTIPYVVIVWAALLVIVTLALVFTRFGRSVYAVGSNRRASEFGGILLVGYTGSAYLGMGDSYLLPSIAVVVIGGTSILGGRGSYVQTVAGALLITVIESALITVGVDQPGQDVLYGGVILLMAYVNQVAVSGAGRRLTFSGSALGPLRGWIEPVRRPGDGAGVPDDPGG